MRFARIPQNNFMQSFSDVNPTFPGRKVYKNVVGSSMLNSKFCETCRVA